MGCDDPDQRAVLLRINLPPLGSAPRPGESADSRGARTSQVRSMCGVTDKDLEQATGTETGVYTAASRRDTLRMERSESTLRVSGAWTLTDRA